MKEEIQIAILGAVLQEALPFADLLEDSLEFKLHGERFWKGSFGNHRVLIGATGLGKVNAAIVTSSLLERFRVLQVWNVGCAGAYSDGPLALGDVLIATEMLCGDEGVLTRSGPLPTDAIAIPILKKENKNFYHAIPLDIDLVKRVEKELPSGCYRLNDQGLAQVEIPVRVGIEDPRRAFFALFHGPSLTVGMVSGDLQTAAQRFRQHHAFMENMEGSAVAQTCFRFGVPMMECRGITNLAGERDKEKWDIAGAIRRCRGIVLRWLSVGL